VRNLSQNLTARIQTKHGLTTPIKIKDSIRQGGILSGAQYALLMDEINKKIMAQNNGIKIPNTDTKVGCLLWMDDVAFMSTEQEEMQELLNITNEISKRYHIEFGKEKSKFMKIEKKQRRKHRAPNLTTNQNDEKISTFKLGSMTIEETNNYKYLGETMNNQGNMTNQIESIKRKIEAPYQTIIIVASNKKFRDLQMETIWRLVETCITPIILYGAETSKPTTNHA
jgi:hypothetical protein